MSEQANPTPTSNAMPKLSRRGLTWVLIAGAVVILFNLLAILFLSINLDAFWVSALRWVAKGLLIVVLTVLTMALVGLVRLRYFSPFLSSLKVERHVDKNLPLHLPSDVVLRLSYEGDVHIPDWLTLSVMDHTPSKTLMQGLPVAIKADALPTKAGDGVEHGVQISYELVPTARGLLLFDGVSVRLDGWLGLWSWYCYLPKVSGVSGVRAFADFKSVVSGNLIANAQKSAVDGIIKRRLQGQGQDFYQLRQHAQGDGLRRVDWRATSRLMRLMSKDYQDEQEQEILFLLDASQNMRHQKHIAQEGRERITGHLDMALTSMLSLASVALKQGDSVGFISFSGQNDKIAPPKKGVSALNYLLNQSFDVAVSLSMPDYLLAIRQALALLKKRGLIILLTSTRSENFDELLSVIQLINGKHLLIVANLYEKDLADYLNKPLHLPEDAQVYHSVISHLSVQRSLHAKLLAQPKVYPIHCTPEELPNRLLQTYFGV